MQTEIVRGHPIDIRGRSFVRSFEIGGIVKQDVISEILTTHKIDQVSLFIT